MSGDGTTGAGWRDIATAPKYGPILACQAECWTFIARWNPSPRMGAVGWWRVSDTPYGTEWLGHEEVTHWMPLPAPPAAPPAPDGWSDGSNVR